MIDDQVLEPETQGRREILEQDGKILKKKEANALLQTDIMLEACICVPEKSSEVG